jgi:ubiquitin-activating enzyme E1
LDSYKNGFVNLALPLMAFSSPIASPKLDVPAFPLPKLTSQFKEMDKIWDRFDVPGTFTLKQFIEYFKKEKGLEITMLSCGVTLLYNGFFAHKQQQRMGLTLPKLVETVSRKPVPPHAKDLIFEICADDATGEDVEVPFVRVDLRPVA